MSMSIMKPQFVAWAYENIKRFLPDSFRDADVEIHQVKKTGMTYTGMTVKREGQKMAPAINLDEMFEAYQNDMPLPVIAAKMASIVQTETPAYDISIFNDYEKIREWLFIRVCNYDANKEMLASVPHKRIEDLAITYHVMVNVSDDGDVSSAIISNEIISAFGVSKERLHQDAMASSPRLAPAKVDAIGNVISELSGESAESFKIPAPNFSMIVVTNRFGINGAAALFYPGMMERIAEKMHGNFYVLPSSVHEIIALPASLNTDGERLSAMVQDINATVVDPADRLSDNAYLYDADSRTFRVTGGNEA